VSQSERKSQKKTDSSRRRGLRLDRLSLFRIQRFFSPIATADEQRRRLRLVGLIVVLVGALLWAILASPIARTMPASWLWPELMAALAAHADVGRRQQLKQAGDAQASTGVRAGNRLMLANRRWRRVANRQPG
jgi:hypothetical protein